MNQTTWTPNTRTWLVLVPKHPELVGIDQGSGIVTPQADLSTAERIKVWYEGNRFGASNLGRYVQRVYHAASRGDSNYPTIAFGLYEPDQFDVVATFDLFLGELSPSDAPRMNSWSGEDGLDLIFDDTLQDLLAQLRGASAHERTVLLTYLPPRLRAKAEALLERQNAPR